MIVITGASDGLGKELAKQLIAEGKKIVSLSREEPAKDILHIPTDLSKKDDISSAVARILAMDEPLEALINNAGLLSIEEFGKLTFDEIEYIMQVNVNAAVLLTSGLLDKIKQDEGDIVNVVSTNGVYPRPKRMTYSVSKWGLRGFTENLQAELRETKVRVIGFYPGGFKSSNESRATGKPLRNPHLWVEVEDMALALKQAISLPKDMEVSTLVINRKRFQ